MDWTVQGSNAGGSEIFCTCSDGPEHQPTSYTMGTVTFPRVKRPGRGVDQPLLTSAEAKERVELYIYSASGPSWPVLG